MDGLPQPKRQRRAAAAARGMPGLPPEVVAAIGGYCCRSSLDALICTSKQIRDGCKGVSKPWPTNRGCPLVKRLCAGNAKLPEEPEYEPDSDDQWSYGFYEYQQSSEFKQYVRDLRSITPPCRELIVLHNPFGPSFLALGHGGGHFHSSNIAQPTLQLWSKEYGLVWQEVEPNPSYPYDKMRIAVTPPLGLCGSQFLILSARRDEPDGVRMVNICKPSPEREPSQRFGEGDRGRGQVGTVHSFRLPCEVISVECVGGSDDPCLIFMDSGEDAVQLCRITIEEGKGQGGGGSVPHLSEPEIIVSDPSRTSQRRSSLAVFSHSDRAIIACSYDVQDTCINIYDMKRKVSVVVPVPEAGWIRDIAFSPGGKTLVVAHHHYDSWGYAISLYDCDADRIECIAERPPKFFRVEERGYCDNIGFSPKGTMLSFQWCPKDAQRRVFAPERVGMIDLAPLKDADDGSNISIEILIEAAQWERFASS